MRIGPESDDNLYLRIGHIAFDESNAVLLIDLLPPLVAVRADDPYDSRLAQSIDLLASEESEPRRDAPPRRAAA